MSYLIIPLRSVTASFRDPEFQNFHRSLPLPPPSTCIGLAGAALGLAPAAAQDHFTEEEWEIGIAGTSSGLATDLWKYNDFKTGSILIREILYGNRFTIVFGHADQRKLTELRSAFLRPRYALSCGPSDSICRVDVSRLKIVEGEVSENSDLIHCYVAGDIIADSLSIIREGGSADFSIRTTSTPLAQDLPVRFDYEKGGVRMLKERRLISYVRYPTRLPRPVSGIFQPSISSDDIPLFIPVFPL